MSRNKYERVENDGETCCEEYDLLAGPNGFECFLGEPEDRTWRRDAKDVVDELNRLHDWNRAAEGGINELLAAHKLLDRDRLGKALNGLRILVAAEREPRQDFPVNKDESED